MVLERSVVFYEHHTLNEEEFAKVIARWIKGLQKENQNLVVEVFFHDILENKKTKKREEIYHVKCDRCEKIYRAQVTRRGRTQSYSIANFTRHMKQAHNVISYKVNRNQSVQISKDSMVKTLRHGWRKSKRFCSLD